MATLVSAHLTLFAAFGVWVWFTIYHFGDCNSFTRDTRLTILPGVNIRVTSPLQIWFIMLYIICLMPFLNIIFIGALEFLAIFIVRLIFSPWLQRKTNLGGFIVSTLFLQGYFIITTEFTIQDNWHLLVESAQEGDWTFGQTLAVALVAIPLVDVVKHSWKEHAIVWDIITKCLLLQHCHGKHNWVVLSIIFSLILNPRSASGPWDHWDDGTSLASSHFDLLHCYQLDIHSRPLFYYASLFPFILVFLAFISGLLYHLKPHFHFLSSAYFFCAYIGHIQ